jgi:putative transposase
VRAFIDTQRERFGVELICRALQVAPSGYWRYAAGKRNPALLPVRAVRDVLLVEQVQRVHQANMQVYGVRKVWRQLRREGAAVARCTVERLMRLKGLQGARRGIQNAVCLGGYSFSTAQRGYPQYQCDCPAASALH